MDKMGELYIITRELPSFLQGTLVAIEVLLGLITLGFVLGLILAVMKVSGNKIISTIAVIIQRTLWGIPQVVLLLLVFYLPFNLPPIIVAIVALGLCSAAFQSQIFLGAIQSLKSGQMMAARALGMSRLRALRYVILPQAIRRAIGPWSNEFSSELKDTSLAYIVGVAGILRRGQYIISYTHGHSLLIYVFVAIIYLILTKVGNSLVYYLEGKLWVPGFERRNTKRQT